MAEKTSMTCRSCLGTGGKTYSEIKADGSYHEWWVPCGPCQGTGVAK